MAERFMIDPANPGEVLACAGLAWLADRAEPGAQSGFIEHGGRWYFEVPFAPEPLMELTANDPQAHDDHLAVGPLRLDWWQRDWGLNPAFKFWAGQQTAQSVLTNLLHAARPGAPADWLSFMAPTTGRLGVDPRGNWDSLSLGWSINEHNKIKNLCRPYVEWLAFLGLQAFPVQGDRTNGLHYHLWRPAPLTIAVLAFAGAGRHAIAGYTAGAGKSGSNTYLKSGQPFRSEP
ncbi:hypothetical protein LY622_15730 [Halomonas sp. M5N1S17]|uniref:hypothetical protein n=1 Tax=Halomonas alkalisoli TaxID=2907158 RepID=UPI001F3A98F9|nr:hypothetical protein [Halomonas alkalisoli]MCE9664888.1 hypothetical protein [Halomonas alkalisoli]